MGGKMKYRYFYSFLFLFSSSYTQPFDVIPYISPIFSFMVGTFTYFSFITDHFIPASRQELYTTEQRITKMHENNRCIMQEYAQKNIREQYEQTKTEVEAKIDSAIATCYQKSRAIKEALDSTQTLIIKKIERSHRIRMQSLKNNLASYADSTQEDITALIKKLTLAYEKRESQIQHQCTQILNLLSNFQKKLHQKTITTQRIIQNTTQEHTNLLTNNHDQIKNNYDQTAEKCNHFFIQTSEKLDAIERLCCILKGVIAEQKQKNIALYKQILALKKLRKNDSLLSIKNAFGSNKSLKNYSNLDYKQ